VCPSIFSHFFRGIAGLWNITTFGHVLCLIMESPFLPAVESLSK
jgi:hypothetical protein